MSEKKINHPLFSVVIPLYNKVDTIERAVRSVVAQTCTDWELIIVNDGSTDGSLAVVKHLATEFRIKIIDKPNGGVSSARNAGANAAVGEYIALLDGDDIWYPRHLERMRKSISRYPDIKFFGAGYERITGKCVYFTIPWGGCKVIDVFSMLRYGQPINSSTVVIEKGAWHHIGGFDLRYSFYEDFEFFFRLGMHTKCCVIQKIDSVYTNDAISQATKKRHNFSRIMRPHLALIDTMLSEGGTPSEMRRYARTQVILQCSLSNLGLSTVAMEAFNLHFPEVSKLVSLNAKRMLRVPCISYAYIIYYKVRNYLILWRRRI